MKLWVKGDMFKGGKAKNKIENFSFFQLDISRMRRHKTFMGLHGEAEKSILSDELP